MNYDEVIAVNEQDEVIDYLDKLEVHQKGILHRAISVFIINHKGEWLLQQRAAHKYHSGLLWTNASCTHPLKGEQNLEAAKRRLYEEMGMSAHLTKMFSFHYCAELDNQLTENELDHVFIGYTDDLPEINPNEAAGFKYMLPNQIEKALCVNPDTFTEWFKLLFHPVRKHLKI